MRLLLAALLVSRYSPVTCCALLCCACLRCLNRSVCKTNSVACIWCDLCPGEGSFGKIPISSILIPTQHTLQLFVLILLVFIRLPLCSSAAGYSGDRCQVAPPGKQTCANGGASSDFGACKNGSICKLNSVGLIYCDACTTPYSGARCEVGTSAKTQSCANGGASSDFGACQNGSICTLNTVGLVYCDKCPGELKCTAAPWGPQ